VNELAADGIAVAVTCRVLKLARQPYYRWRADPVTNAECAEAYRANALFDAHRDDPEFGYRYLVEEARAAGEPMAERTAWRICTANRWWSVFGKKRGKNGKPGPPVHDDLVARDFTAEDPNTSWLADITEHSTPGGQALPLRDQGRLLQPHRRVLHGLTDDVTVGHHCAQSRRGSPR
jgi:putative transposase